MTFWRERRGPDSGMTVRLWRAAWVMLARAMPFLQVPVMSVRERLSRGLVGSMWVASTRVPQWALTWEMEMFLQRGIPSEPGTGSRPALPLLTRLMPRKVEEPTSRSEAEILVMKPPRPVRLLMKMALEPRVKVQCWMRTLLMPPDISVPMPMPAKAMPRVQSVMRTSAVGLAMCRPSRAAAGFERDGVVAGVDVAVVDVDVGGRFDIDAVAVGFGGADVEIFGEDVVAVEEVDGPHAAVAV